MEMSNFSVKFDDINLKKIKLFCIVVKFVKIRFRIILE